MVHSTGRIKDIQVGHQYKTLLEQEHLVSTGPTVHSGRRIKVRVIYMWQNFEYTEIAVLRCCHPQIFLMVQVEKRELTQFFFFNKELTKNTIS